MTLSEKVSYTLGLMDGLEINESTKEGKILKQMAEIMKEMASTIEDIQLEVDEVVELVDILDQDLGAVEEDIYDFDDCDCCDDEDCDCCDDELYEVICPSCSDTICLDESMIGEGSIKCPNCGELLEFDFEEDTDEEQSYKNLINDSCFRAG